MKKSIAFAMMFLCASILFAESYAVYNFKASLKRIEPVLTIQRAGGVNSRHLSYRTVTDTITGYLVVPECCDASDNGGCVTCGNSSLFGKNELDESNTYLYIFRKGEKIEKNSLVKIKADYVFASVFGQRYNSAYNGSNAEDAVFKKLKNSSFAMSCVFPEKLFDAKFYGTGTPTNGMRELDYGMLGYTCLDGTMFFTGYGSASPIMKKTEDIGVCYSEIKTVKCIRITSVSGNMTGMFNYGNPAICETCDEWAIVDPCSYYEPVYQSPVSGTWMVKYNSAISERKFKTREEIEDYLKGIVKKKEIIDCENIQE
jgi:hypothetical protein